MLRIMRPQTAWTKLVPILAAFCLSAAAAIPELASPLTLERAIRLALDNDPAIKVQAYNPEIARANVLVAEGFFDPVINAGRSTGREFAYEGEVLSLPSTLFKTDNYNLTLDGVLPTGLAYSVGGQAFNERGPLNNFVSAYQSFAGINLTQPLLRGFGFGVNLVNVRVARANRSITKWQYRQTLIDTITSVVLTYSNLELAHDNLQIAERSRELGATLVKESQQRLKAGSGAQSEVTAARAQVAAREEPILLEASAVRNTENQLRELIGERSFPPDHPAVTLVPMVAPEITVHPEADYQIALSHRPDYQAARLGIVINRAQNAAARNGLLPQVNLVVGYGYNGLANTFAASRHMLATGDFPSSSVGLNLSIPLTNAQGRGRARAARLTLEQSEADLRRREADIAVDVANAADQIKTASDRVVADQKAYELATRALENEVKKFRAGSIGSSTYTVIQAQETLIAAENSLATARASQIQVAAIYDQQLGTTFERYNISLSDNL